MPEQSREEPQVTPTDFMPYTVQSQTLADTWQRDMQKSMQTMANPFSYYRDLVDELVQLSHLQILPICEVAHRDRQDRPVVSLRHDIDADIWTGIRAARHLARNGVCGSFYILPSAGYYGQFHQSVFYRNTQVEGFVEALLEAGCEIGLHNDALSYFRTHQVDGIEAIQTELQWLRERGAQIRGTATHNSFPLFGAESFEIFKEWQLFNRDTEDSAGDLPLGSISATSLELTYEANLPQPLSTVDRQAVRAFDEDTATMDIRNPEWMRVYLSANPCCSFGWDAQCWLVGRDWWIISCTFGETTAFYSMANRADLLAVLQELPDGATCCLVIHPCYVNAEAP
jgi:hypothetical protein